jgi:hypothetical protein
MIPSISRNGTSFRGAGAYHLHDKPQPGEPRPRTSERIAFTTTRNLANDDPRHALDEMWRTARDAIHLKDAIGLRRSGRRNDAPVKTISLSWAPGQTPGQGEMIAAADDFLRRMGWHQHQAVYVAHNDTAHPHLHIILNRVHPDTGRTLNDWQDRKRAQAWALSYERRQGAVLCQGRALRHDGGARIAPAGLPHRQAKLLAGHPPADRQLLARAQRRQSRPAWAGFFRRSKARLADLGARQRAISRVIVTRLREGDHREASRLLERFQREHRHVHLTLGRERARLVRLDHVRLRARLNRVDAATPAANDNAGAAGLTTTHRAERQQLAAAHRAAAACLGRRNASEAAALARSEIALAFATRWAAIRQLPADQRAAAAAALKAEQAASLSARLAFHVSRLGAEASTRRGMLRSVQETERHALRSRQHLAAVASRPSLHLSPIRPATG